MSCEKGFLRFKKLAEARKFNLATSNALEPTLGSYYSFFPLFRRLFFLYVAYKVAPKPTPFKFKRTPLAVCSQPLESLTGKENV